MIEKLASALGRADEGPNIELAERLIKTNDRQGIKTLVDALDNKDKHIVNDAIKVIYEVGERQPTLIKDYVTTFLSLLESKNNRLVWGAMMTLSTLAPLEPKAIYDKIDLVKDAYKKGSVITIDNSISVFAKLCKANPLYSKNLFPFLIKHLENCRAKEIPQHSLRIAICVNKDNKDPFIAVLEKRKPELTPSQEKRVRQVISALN